MSPVPIPTTLSPSNSTCDPAVPVKMSTPKTYAYSPSQTDKSPKLIT